MNKETGKKGEDIAVDYLVKQGYQILERNIHFSRNCEIDIIAKRKNTLHFIEVKTRLSENFGQPLEAITKSKYEKIKTGVFSYIKDKNLKNMTFQIDGIAVILKPNIVIKHVKNI